MHMLLTNNLTAGSIQLQEQEIDSCPEKKRPGVVAPGPCATRANDPS